MSLVVARERRIVSANVTDTVMNGIVPVVIVIGILAIPPTVMRLESVMGPADTRICAGDDNVLPGEPLRPYLRRVRVIDPGFDRLRLLQARGDVDIRVRFRKVIVDARITLHAGDVRTRS